MTTASRIEREIAAQVRAATTPPETRWTWPEPE